MKEKCIIIPVRYNSTRFPGKALIDLCGKSMIQRTWEKCILAVPKEDVFVATDSDIIQNHCKELRIQTIMTYGECLTGTDRVAEAYKNLGVEYKTIVNVQGDEPLIDPMDITLVINEHKWVFAYDSICCGMCRIYTETEFFNPNIIKIVFDENKNLLYASRSPIPGRKKCEFHQEAYKQVCIYAFTGERLEFFSSEEQGYLEKNEEIEMLRFMERGGSIRMVEVSANSISVDIPDDADRVRQILKGKEELCKNF